MSDCDGLATFKMGFYHTAHVVNTVFFVAVLIAQMNIYLDDLFAVAVESIFHYAANLCNQRLVPFDIVVGIDLNLYGVLQF